jgi:23S rRNA (uracil1939-C5)-methyltransferase
MSPDLLTVKLEKLVYGGDALGRIVDPAAQEPGRVVFVPFGVPGETVRVRPREVKPGHIRAELVEVVEASPERIAPTCIHFGLCGGCHYQHLPYPAQLNIKTEIVRDQLKRIGKIDDPPVKKMVPSMRPWNYRNHVQFHLTPAGKVGYMDASGRNVMAVTECHLPESLLNDLWPRLEFEPGSPVERVSLRLGAAEEAMLVLESDSGVIPEMELETGLSVIHLSGGDEVVLAGDGYLVMQVKDRPFRVSAGAFFQVNTEMAGQMVDHLLDRLPLTQASTLLDIYCGVGLFSAFFAGRVSRVIGIEASASACSDFTVNLDEFDNVELYEAPAEDVLPELKLSAEAVIVDPPRAGLDKRVLQALLESRPERLAYVSCDPSTLSRDARHLLAGGYRLIEITPFDLFPHTYHIESISIFERDSGS